MYWGKTDGDGRLLARLFTPWMANWTELNCFHLCSKQLGRQLVPWSLEASVRSSFFFSFFSTFFFTRRKCDSETEEKKRERGENETEDRIMKEGGIYTHVVNIIDTQTYTEDTELHMKHLDLRLTNEIESEDRHFLLLLPLLLFSLTLLIISPRQERNHAT